MIAVDLVFLSGIAMMAHGRMGMMFKSVRADRHAERCQQQPEHEDNRQQSPTAGDQANLILSANALAIDQDFPRRNMPDVTER